MATKAGDAEVILGFPAMLLAGLHHLFPDLNADLLGMVNEFVLPSLKGSAWKMSRGSDLDFQWRSLAIDIFNRIKQFRTKQSVEASEAGVG